MRSAMLSFPIVPSLLHANAGAALVSPRLAALLRPQMSPAFSVVTPLPAGRLAALGATTNFQDAN